MNILELITTSDLRFETILFNLDLIYIKGGLHGRDIPREAYLVKKISDRPITGPLFDASTASEQAEAFKTMPFSEFQLVYQLPRRELKPIY